MIVACVFLPVEFLLWFVIGIITMINALRSAVACRLKDAMIRVSNETSSLWLERMDHLQWCIRINNVSKRSDLGPQISVSLKHLEDSGLLESIPLQKHGTLLESLAEKITKDNFLHSTYTSSNDLMLSLDHSQMAKAILSDIQANAGSYGRQSSLYDFMYIQSLNGTLIEKRLDGQTIVVEFSSPNIAKLFHAGHLRSTILGQYISNINEWFGQNVIKINYLGDWGTQFGLLGVGFNKYGNLDALKANPLQHLYDIYVRINLETKTDESVHSEGMKYFKRMEEGDDKALQFWKLCCEVSVEEYKKMYERLGINFTHIHGESMYSKLSYDVINELKTKGLLLYDVKTGVGYVDLTQPQDNVPLHGNLVKSDGTSLYLTRDVAAAIDRRLKFSCDKFHYVVENGQHLHFKQLLRILRLLGHWWGVHLLDNVHIKFGRVEGMSSRKGDVVILKDILDEAKAQMLQRMRTKTTTKVTEEKDQEAVAEALGLSAIIVQDLKEYRNNNYKFSWERMLNFNGDTGLFLQYTHARLHSLVSNNADIQHLSSVGADFESLQENSAKRLIQHLGRFDEVLLRSYSELEPCHLVQYLFMLGHLVSVAHDELHVKGAQPEIAKDRLTLFESSRTVLATGLKLLGIKPLNHI